MDPYQLHCSQCHQALIPVIPPLSPPQIPGKLIQVTPSWLDTPFNGLLLSVNHTDTVQDTIQRIIHDAPMDWLYSLTGGTSTTQILCGRQMSIKCSFGKGNEIISLAMRHVDCDECTIFDSTNQIFAFLGNDSLVTKLEIICRVGRVWQPAMDPVEETIKLTALPRPHEWYTFVVSRYRESFLWTRPDGTRAEPVVVNRQKSPVPARERESQSELIAVSETIGPIAMRDVHIPQTKKRGIDSTAMPLQPKRKKIEAPTGVLPLDEMAIQSSDASSSSCTSSSSSNSSSSSSSNSSSSSSYDNMHVKPTGRKEQVDFTPTNKVLSNSELKVVMSAQENEAAGDQFVLLR